MTEKQDEFEVIESIAIIGMSARFAGAGNIAEFWKNLCEGVESITFFSVEELVKAGRDPDVVNLPNYVRARPVLKDIDRFDAAFFNIPPSEAEILDPQHRVFLECAWEALEDAAYDPEAYAGLVGVFAGSTAEYYLINNLAPHYAAQRSPALHAVVANGREFMSTRVSYKLNLKGPSVNVMTACSTSLVATHLACQSLLNYQSDMALAGGVSILVPQESGYLYWEGGFDSPDGHCRPFDARANGLVFGSGAGVVLLKRLSDALKDRDHIYAVLKGSALNNDGSLKVSFAAPGLEGQKKVIEMALAVAGVDPSTISYVEAHGTGTALGDPVEIEALTQVYRSHTDKKKFCGIGAVKGNIGHTEAAAGIANLIKVSLALKHKLLPATLNCETINPRIDFDNSPFYVNTELREWKSEEQVCRAGVSSFGLGGTNAHVILEQAPRIEPSGESRRYQLLALSARTSTALEKMTDNLIAHLQADPDLKLADVAYTLHVGRQAFESRRMVLCQTSSEAVAALQECDPARVLTRHGVKSARSVVFMFPGQGAEYVGMGRELYQREPLFRKHVDACTDLLKPHLGFDLRDALYPTEAEGPQAIERLNREWLGQLALFVVEYALARLWMAWGVNPQAMIGEGVGELTAACLAGVLTLKDALAVVAMQRQIERGMAATEQFEKQLRSVRLRTPQIPFISGVTGEWITPKQAADPAYWASHPRQAVRFSDGLNALAPTPEQVLVEIGPGQTLSTLVGQRLDLAPGQVVLSAMRQPHETWDDEAFLLRAVGQLWLAGVQVDWEAFYQNERRSRVSLPTYPFERQRYWIDPPKTIGMPAGSLIKNPNVTDWFYVPSWKCTMPPAPKHGASRWLLFSDGESLSTQLTRRLEALGHPVVIVLAGEQFADRGDAYTVRAAHRGDYQALLAALRERNQAPTHVIHLWNLALPDENATDFIEKTLQHSFYSLLCLAQALGAQIPDQELELVVISSNMQRVAGDEIVYPEKAALLGPCKVIPQEMPSITVRSIDVALPQAGSQQEEKLVEQLIAELEAGAPDLVIAYRGCDRLVQTYEPAPLAELPENPNGNLRKQGVYLITGGLGGIGSALAEYLARSVQAKLVLTDRAQFPNPELWEQWQATHHPQDRTSLLIQFVQALEALGAEVMVVQADVTDRAQMEAAVRAGCERFGAVHGVIHSAGVPGDEMLQLKQEEEAAQVLMPKVYGTRVLEAVFRDRPLDFMMLRSSISAVLGGVGQVDYSAANSFLDAFAQAHQGRGGATIMSVNWDAWGQVEAAASPTSPAAARPNPRDSAHAILPTEGTEAFRRILFHNRLPQIAVCTRHLPTLIRQAAKVERATEFEAPGEMHPRPDLETPYVAPQGEAEKTLAAIWQSILRIEEIGIHDNFFELGGSSIMGIRVVAKARQAGLNIATEQLFQNQTISELASVLQPTRGP